MDINKIRKTDAKVVVVGSYPVMQSIMDFDFIAGKSEPSIKAMIGAGRKLERFFFGTKEVFIPMYASINSIPQHLKDEINLFINVTSGRRVLSSTIDCLEAFPNIIGGTIFAEEVPESHAIQLFEIAQQKKIFITGPASVGLLVPNTVKLGAIGGVDSKQFVASKLFEDGSMAVLSSSGGMTNEIIRMVAQKGHAVSFAMSFGGERFPIVRPMDAFLAAEADPQTKAIVYFGELGGRDEYELADLIKAKKITKPVICYIAGAVAQVFETPPQFGHAKAMAKNQDETAQAKRKALKDAGAIVAETFASFADVIAKQSKVKNSKPQDTEAVEQILSTFGNRKKAMFSSSLSNDEAGVAKVLGEDLLKFSKEHTFAYEVVSMFLGKKIKSKELEAFVDIVLRLSVDHGPYVSGAVNTMITARAGKDLVSSLTAGLLTIGPRFGGAINQAAANWFIGATGNINPADYVEDMAARKVYIQGIGHRKYRIDLPDPRVAELLTFTESLKKKRFTTFAKGVEAITVSKKGNLILNVDGAIAAVLLDILSEKEGYTDDQLKELIDIEFFNALFVLSRSVGFIGHFLDQKRLDEGLFRLDDTMVAHVDFD